MASYSITPRIFLILFWALPCTLAKYSANNTFNAKVQANTQGLYLSAIAKQFSIDLNRTSNEELGVPFIHQLYETFKYVDASPDPETKLPKIANRLESKLNETFDLLRQIRAWIEDHSKNKLRKGVDLGSVVAPCENEPFDLNDYDPLNIFDRNLTNSYLTPPRSFNEVFSNFKIPNKELQIIVRQRYFLSHADVESSEDSNADTCQKNDSLMWSMYASRMKSARRNIFLLLDHGMSLSRHQIAIVKALAEQAIDCLNENDKIGILSVSDEIKKPSFGGNVASQQRTSTHTTFMPADKFHKKYLYKFVQSLVKANGSTNHSLGFQTTFEKIYASTIPANETVMLLYVSRGLLSSLTEAKIVLETIFSHLEDARHKIIINTCAVIDDAKPVLYETHFLRDIADQNYSKYNIDSEDISVHRGIMLLVNSPRRVGLAMMRFLRTIDPELQFDLRSKLSEPKWDPDSNSLIITASIPCGAHGEIGVLGVNLDFAGFAEEVTYYSNYENYSNAFLMNTEGMVVAHPSYPLPLTATRVPHFANINRFEFELFRRVKENNHSRDEQFYMNDKKKYYWRPILNFYIVGIVVNELYPHSGEPRRPYKVTWFPASSNTQSQLVHHRLDIIPASKMCKHFNQLATLEAGSLFLSASCFQSPTAFAYSSISSFFSPLSVQKCMAFLKDNTRYLSNPGLRDEIRDEVAALAHVLEYLRSQHLQSAKSRYIVRRYVSSLTGVLLAFPGGILSTAFAPTRRMWYLRAKENLGKIILTPPYLDAGGAGYIISLAYATDFVVVGMDVTFGYVFKLILEHMPFCAEKLVKCFMIDDRGYLIYHPNLIDPNGHGPIEQQHIIHKESPLANDLLNHNHFIEKMLCDSFADGTIQRYYTLNMSIDGVVVNTAHGEHSVKYQISPIRGTNAFVGFVNVSDEVITTFCPCSMINRLCLNCNRMEQRECECPCECPILADTSNVSSPLPRNPLCQTVPEHNNIADSLQYKIIHDDLKSCLPISCESLSTYNECLGVLGCEWCQMGVDAETPLATPFCTSIQTCFNGILGSPTPYGDMSHRVLDTDDLLTSTYSPIGPVIGSVLAVALILIFSFICYRSYTSPSNGDRFYLTSSQDNQVPMSDLNISDDYHELENHQDKLLKDVKPEPLSPYCVSTMYKRPHTAADSDHGYSTMTPHDESEHLSFTPHEIDSLEDETSDAASINTSFSPKRRVRLIDRNKKLVDFGPTTTAIPSRHYIIAPVTVHRNMEYAQ